MRIVPRIPISLYFLFKRVLLKYACILLGCCTVNIRKWHQTQALRARPATGNRLSLRFPLLRNPGGSASFGNRPSSQAKLSSPEIRAYIRFRGQSLSAEG